MSQANHKLVRDFFGALSIGHLPDELFADSVTIWTNTSGNSDKAKYQGGVKMFQSLFQNGYNYRVDSLTAEDNRVAAEAIGQGRLKDGEDFQNTYVFVFRILHGRISSIAEHCNSVAVRDKIVPLFQAAAKR